jgi:hypothetical protein
MLTLQRKLQKNLSRAPVPGTRPQFPLASVARKAPRFRAAAGSHARGSNVSTPHAIELPAGALAALRQYMAQAEIDAILVGEGPLTKSERQQLNLALKWWQEQQATAFGRIRAITGRLTDSPAGT